MATMAVPLTNGLVTAQPRILIADDQPDVLEALRLLLKGQGYATETVSSPATLLEAMRRQEFDLILMDLNYARDTTSGREGIDLLAQLQGLGGAPPIVVMTGWASVGLAVEAMQHGVGDFVEKPWTNSRLLEILKKQIEMGRARRESRRQDNERQRKRDEIALQAERQEREVEETLRIQKDLLPRRIPQISGYKISAAWQPARTVGGDYYDVLEFEGNSLGICIADVAGKGLAAAMLMANLQAAVRGLTTESTAPEHLCERLNALVRRNIANDRFITLFYAHLDGPGRKFCYTNAGHNAPILVHRDGSCHRLDQGGGVLGAFESQSYTMGIRELAAGDRVVFFTDGITEACPSEQSGAEHRSVDQVADEFGETRLLELIAAHRQESAEELQGAILKAVGEHCSGHWSDDATLIVLAVES
jgi:phosphoserine phosphatase RsbU/P